jgi:hypothetical protein
MAELVVGGGRTGRVCGVFDETAVADLIRQ